MGRPTCGTCLFYEFQVCRRHAPVAVALDWETEFGAACAPIWPLVHSKDDWCGEHPDFPAYLESLKATKTE